MNPEFLGAISRACIILLLCLLFAAPAQADRRQIGTITNVATVSWGPASALEVRASNRVDVAVFDPRTELSVFRLSSDAAAIGGALASASCTMGGAEIPFTQMRGTAPAAATQGSGENVFEPADGIRAGEPLILRIDRQSANLSAATVDLLVVRLETREGDGERLTLVESGANTGLFVGGVATVASMPPTRDDCQLSVRPGETLSFDASNDAGDESFGYSDVNVLIDPFGIVFDSLNGSPVPGVTITMVDADTGLPADVFGDDGVSRYPSTVVTGRTVFDSGGTRYDFPPGDYRFPLARPGRYRLVVEPPAPYVAPSTADPQEMARFLRPDGIPYTIVDGSFGGIIVLDDPAPVRVDIPIDRPAAALTLSKRASVALAEPGDIVEYGITVTNPDAIHPSAPSTLVDLLPPEMRLRPGSVRLDGEPVEGAASADGQRITVPMPALAPGATATLRYLLEVRADAREGEALNRALLTDSRGTASNVAQASVRIRRDTLADRMTIIGRVVAGTCSADPALAQGVPGIRVMMEDGSYAVTDLDGRYHFNGVKPGLRVVQLDEMTVPQGMAPVDCARNSRSAGSAISRFVEGRGGALKRVDFHLTQTGEAEVPAAAPAARPEPVADAVAAGGDRDWLKGQEPGIAWLFPAPDHNPRAPVVRVAIKHFPGQKVALSMNGRPVGQVSLDGIRKSADGKVAVSLWRGLVLADRQARFTAEVRNADGSLAETLTRTVHYSGGPMQAELVPEKSVLVADGITRPVIALRMTDRDGRPVHHGMVGSVEIPAPYYAAIEADAQQARQLAGLERARPVWRVIGDEGIAYVELEPTTASGSVDLRFQFRDGRTTREQRIEAWLDPGDRPWTIVGVAAGTAGFNKLEGHMEELADSNDETLVDGRLALYAKGKISGKWLMTLAYDSDKEEDETDFAGVIDPQAYYTVYADRSERRYDAASVRRLYLRLERPQFYALFGDYDTGIDEPVLARYVRALNGVKAEYRSQSLSATAFAADTPTRHRRDEIQGNGLTGPYALGARNILPNSERVMIEVRDRLRSNRIVETRLLTRHIDYDIDYAAGVLRFREPILSRGPSLDPQFIVADYEVDGVARREINAGARASWRSDDQRLQVSATAIRDESSAASTLLGGADIRYRASPSTEIRAEIAVSDASAKPGARAADGTATAWLVEAEHHGGKYDVLAYAREQESGFGVGQVNAGGNGTRKIGVDGRAELAPNMSLIGSAWHEDYLESDARRVAGRLLAEYRTNEVSGRVGLTLADDRLADGSSNRSTLLQLGASKRFLDNRLELDAQTEFPIAGDAESIDFPARHRLGGRYAISPDVHLVGTYEIAQGDAIDARTARLGFDLKPWAGARIAASGNVQNISEYGPRSFAAFGLSQSVVLDEHWTVDASLDSNQSLGGVDPADIVNPDHPIASGGHLNDGLLAEDFVAVTAGATYRSKQWSLTGRAEYRSGDRDDRYGFTAGLLRQIGEGSALGGALNWFVAKAENGAETSTANVQLSWAHRPAGSAWSFLEKLELRDDRVIGAVAGVPGPLGVPLTIAGDARSRRAISSLAVNWSQAGGAKQLGRSEVSLFWGSRYVSEQFGPDDIEGWSNVLGGDFRFDLGAKLDIGASATVRQGIDGRSFAYSGGPNIGMSPFDNGWMSVGWNLVGFSDRDFEEARYTRSGPYVTMRLKFDQNSLAALGLGR